MSGIIKKRLFIIILFCFLLCGCIKDNESLNEQIAPTISDIISPTTQESNYENIIPARIYFNSDVIELDLDQEEFEFTFNVEPSNASKEVIITLSNEDVVKIVDEKLILLQDGLVDITVTSLLDKNVKNKIEVQVFDLREYKKKVEEAKDYLDKLFDKEIKNDFIMPKSYNGVIFSVSSSNKEILDELGTVNREKDDCFVTLTFDLNISRVSETWSKDVKVLGKGYEGMFKPLVHGKIVTMYLANNNFQFYRSDELEDIDIIYHAFARINTQTHEITTKDLTHHETIIKEAHKNGTRVILSVGGWNCDGFSDACVSEENRVIFVNSIIKIVKEYGYDGVDIDWEYPTNKGAGYTYREEDSKNFILMMKLLKDELNKLDENLLLTAALTATNLTNINKYYTPKELNKYIDYANIMCYHHPLYTTSKFTNSIYNKKNYSVDQYLNWYMEAGILRTKLILGVAFYGNRYLTKDNGLNGDGFDAQKSDKFTITFKELESRYLTNPKFIKYYDQESEFYWIYYNNIFISYDSEETLKAKCEYIQTKNFAGITVWCYCLDSNNGTLSKTIINYMKK